MTDVTVAHDLGQAVNADRVSAWIDRFAALSEPNSGPGVTRLGYTPLEREAHQVFATGMSELGLSVHTDAAGNTIAELPGTMPALPAIGTGSHLDSVPNGGRFDGIAGVVAAIEVATLLVQSDHRPRHAVRFVVFANEEGARFGQACNGSRMIAGLTTSADLGSLVDKDGTNLAEAMQSVDLDPTRVGLAQWRAEEWAAFVELHIEQGSVLAEAGVPVGVVDLISGSTRLKLEITGRASHSGGTPMHLRVDALAAAAEIVGAGERIATDARYRGTRITVGRLRATPGSITTIPGGCDMTVDVRDVDSDRQREAANELLAAAYAIAGRRGAGIRAALLGDASPVLLPSVIRAGIMRAARGIGLPYRVLPSGASHDSQMINRVVPAGMIFVPSQNHGVSHAPEELTTTHDLAVGIELLRATLLELDTTIDSDRAGSRAPSHVAAAGDRAAAR